jgi:UDP-glucose 4-epimerase
MHMLLTGASGFVGQSLCRQLFANSYSYTSIQREALDPESYPDAYECIIHLAGRAHVMHETAEDIYQAYATVNIDYTLKVAELAGRLKIKRFVFLSSIKINKEESGKPFTEADTPGPLDAYSQTKLEAEIALKEFCAAHQMELVIIRPPLIYGPGVKANFRQLIKLCLLPLPLPFAAVHNKRSFISLENLADFIILCSWHPKAADQTFLISDDEDVSTGSLIKTIRQVSNKNSLLIPLPVWLLKMLFKLTGKSNLALRLIGSLQVDISKAKTFLGWQPKISFQEGILRTLKDNHV